MSTFFDKLPLEIRTLIYEKLLLDKKNPIDAPCCRVPNSKTLYPTILRTCKQANAEGSSILYERNVFRVGPTSLQHHNFVNCDLQNRNFLRIKHLELAYNDEVQERILRMESSPASRLTTVMNSLANFNCTLRTLRLNFGFRTVVKIMESSPDGTIFFKDLTPKALKKFVLQEDFREAVVNSKVESTIKISITSNVVDCNIFHELADAIGLKKQWVVADSSSMPTFITKQWLLTPGTSATGEKVQTLVGGAEEGSSKDRAVDVVDDKS
ncbi:MAG: hypothetical protein Q9195_000447 [Heterodermia aff. obscurata]